MSTKSMPTIAITFESPCPGRLDELLAVSVAATTRSHVASCTRCRAFLSSQTTLRPIVQRAFAACSAPATARTPVTTSHELEVWLESALEHRHEHEVAKAACRIANAVLLTVESFAATTFRGADDEKLWAHVTSLDALSLLVPELIARIDSVASRKSLHARRTTSLRDALQRLDDDVWSSSHPERIAIARRIVDLADEIASHGSSVVHIARSNIDWRWGNVDDVPAHLDRALATSRDRHERSNALTNLAAWSSDQGHVDVGLAQVHAALEIRPTTPVALVNMFLWASMLGDDEADNCLRLLLATRGGRRVLSVQSTENLKSMLKAIEERFGIGAAVARARHVQAMKGLDRARAVAQDDVEAR